MTKITASLIGKISTLFSFQFQQIVTLHVTYRKRFCALIEKPERIDAFKTRITHICG